MKRPLFLTAVFFSSGILLGYYLPLSILSIVLLIVIDLVLIIIFREYKQLILTFFLVFLAGFFWIGWQEVKYQSKLSITVWNDKGEQKIIGEVIEDLSSLQGNKLYLKPYLINQSRIKYGLIQLDKRYLPFKLNNGDIVRMDLSLQTPLKQLNPGGFSNYKYLKKKGIFSQGYLNGEVKRLGRVEHFFKDLIIDLKNRFISILDQTLSKPFNEVMKALLLGERENLTAEWKLNFTRAGANHLLAISGLHVGFVLVILLGILRLIGLPLGLRNFFITLFILLYIILTGLRPSVLRAGLLSLSFLWAPFFKREGDIFNLLGFTALINLIFNPYKLFLVGFQLTYLVLIMIVIWNGILAKYLGPVFAVSLAAQLGSIPIAAYYFNLISPIGVITNIWAIPLVGLIVSIGMLGLLMGLIHPVFSWLINKIVYYLLLILKQGIGLMVRIPFGYLEVPSPSPLILLISYSFLIGLPFILREKFIPVNIKKRQKRIYLTAIIILVVILVQIISPLFQNDFEIIFFAVGQGDGILLNLPGNKHILVDGGGLAGCDSNQGEKTILPYLKKMGIKRLDLVFVTHFDTDHALGVLGLLEQRGVNLLILPKGYKKNCLADKITKLALEKNIPIRLTQEGDNFQIGQVFIRVLNPAKNNYYISRNENSIVLKLTYKKFNLLLTGDLEKEGEWRLVKANYNLKCNVLKLGHHGSASSSAEFFLIGVSPEEAIISVGKNNYGHPSPLVLKRIEDLGIKSWRTDKQGAIIIKTDGLKYRIRGFLDRHLDHEVVLAEE